MAPLRFFNMPILARLTLVEGAIHDINLTGLACVCEFFARSDDGLSMA